MVISILPCEANRPATAARTEAGGWRRPDTQLRAVGCGEPINAANPAQRRHGHRASQARENEVSGYRCFSAGAMFNVLSLFALAGSLRGDLIGRVGRSTPGSSGRWKPMDTNRQELSWTGRHPKGRPLYLYRRARTTPLFGYISIGCGVYSAGRNAHAHTTFRPLLRTYFAVSLGNGCPVFPISNLSFSK
jgi:hypothetical protein